MLSLSSDCEGCINIYGRSGADGSAVILRITKLKKKKRINSGEKQLGIFGHFSDKYLGEETLFF